MAENKEEQTRNEAEEQAANAGCEHTAEGNPGEPGGTAAGGQTEVPEEEGTQTGSGKEPQAGGDQEPDGDENATREAAQDDAEGSADSAPQKKGFFSKIKEKKDKRDAQIEELTDRVRRQMAEFDNFRKRTEKEKSAMYEIGVKSVIEKILPVVDNFERGLSGVGEHPEDPFTAGMQKIYKQLMSTLESLDVKPIEAVGKEFNPDFHNAVMHVEDENLGENIVAEELQKGYTYRDSVVRHSMVKVAN